MAEQIVRQPSSSPTQHNFSQLPTADIERSTFDRSHGWKSTIHNTGMIVPMFWDEVLPGDTFTMNATAFMRLATPLHPIMDNIKIDMHFFFVPNRLLWDKWEIFMGEKRGPTDPDPEDLTLPQASVDLDPTNEFNTLADYLGLPLGQSGICTVQDLPFRAYELIFWEWYRDQNAGDPTLDHPAHDWVDGIRNRTEDFLKKRNKRKDYFTSALPWPQKGDPVVIPLGIAAPVRGIGKINQEYNDANVDVYEAGGNDSTFPSAVILDGELQIDEQIAIANDPSNPGYPWLWTDLSNATSIPINDLRTAFQIQRLLERDARGGTRYIELVLQHFGVQSADSRLQRPEYLGDGSGFLSINPVAATVATEEAPQGQLAATGTGLIKGGFNHSFTEHGIVMGMISTRADLTYQQGIERQWSRSTRYDFYWPALSHLGEQAVLGKEIFFDGTEADDEIFGYQERYAEYRYRPSRIAGMMRSNFHTSLDTWHLAQDFATRPLLNGNFLAENPPLDRILAVPAEPPYIVDAWFEYKCTRPMPVYSVPGMIDHF